MNFQEWLAKNSLVSVKDVLKYTAWYNHQAQESHKQRLDVVNPKDIKLSFKALQKELTRLHLKNELKSIMDEFGISYGVFNIFKNEDAKVPNYLITEEERMLGYHTVYTNTEIEKVDYSGFSIDFEKLHFSKKGDYQIVLPRTNYEVHKGASFMANCMEMQGTRLIQKMKINPVYFEKNREYIDAHILKDNKLVGVLALEEIFSIQLYKEPRKSLFVNYANGVNDDMENFCREWVSEVLGLKLDSYNLGNKSQEVKSSPKTIIPKYIVELIQKTLS